MELWRELLISGLQNENYKFDYTDLFNILQLQKANVSVGLSCLEFTITVFCFLAFLITKTKAATIKPTKLNAEAHCCAYIVKPKIPL
ncbi:MAG: hypothetical protein IJB32_05510 [Clostridia bacterium]|nr:hypothetical protein [Clostridia bacterium]